MNVNRRDFLKIGMLTATAATFTACGRPVEHGVVSQYQMPEYQLPGQSLFWASTCTDFRSDCAVSVKTVENRAIQVIGMPGHFFSKGFANKDAISSLQVLYNPDRLSYNGDKPKGMKFGANGDPSESQGTTAGLAIQKAGAGTLFIVDRVCGTAGHALVQAAVAVGGKIWVADAQQSVRERRILKAVTGRAELPLYPLERYDFVLSVGSNFLHENYAPSRVGWSYGRFRKTPGRVRGRMVSASARQNPTDAIADAWLPVHPGAEATFLAAVGTAVAAKGKSGWPDWANVSPESASAKTGVSPKDIQLVADRLVDAASPLVVGGFQGADGDATVFLAHTLTKMLKGDVVTFDPDTLVGSGTAPVGLFLNDQEAAAFLGTAKAVVVHGVDVNYRFPWLAENFKKVRTKIVLASLPNDTTDEASILVPIRTWLEDWGDLRVESPEGGWYGVTQPSVRSQVGFASSVLGFYLDLAKAAGVASITEVSPRKCLQGSRAPADWEALMVRGGFWKEEAEAIYPSRASYPPPPVATSGSMPDGYSAFSALEPLNVSSLASLAEGLVLMTLPTHLHDGEVSSRPWMQELPDTMTTVVWDSWIEINTERALELGIARHDLVEVTTATGKILGSAYPSSYIHPGAVGIPTGRGQKRAWRPEFVDLGWDPDGSNPKSLMDGSAGSNGYYGSTVAGAKLAKSEGSKMLTTFDQRVFNLPRHILPD
jgi:molybdopterin-containing oxidoreductase family iron-sulfur binding subunit